MSEPAHLARNIGLPLLTLYGLATILGAGIYVLVGKVVGSAGMLAPLAFFVAAVVAGFTALSYAQLVTLFPKSAGEVEYVQQGFNHNTLATLVGALIIIVGTVSCGTLANGFVGYLQVFIESPKWLAISGLLLLFALLAMWGIKESLWVSALMTFVEIAGLLMVVFVHGDALLDTKHNFRAMFLPLSWFDIIGVTTGAFLAFYAFIGFEDMVNVVEEVKEPQQTMASAIVIALIVSASLYMLVALIAVQAMPNNELAASDAPLALLLQHGQNNVLLSNVIALISLFAIINGLLVQIIMASRVLYGMAAAHKAPLVFSRINARTATPIHAIAMIVLLVWVVSIWFPLVALAKMTSFVVLIIFTLINVSLWKVKRHGPIDPEMHVPNYPRLGAFLCLFLLGFQIYTMVTG